MGMTLEDQRMLDSIKGRSFIPAVVHEKTIYNARKTGPVMIKKIIDLEKANFRRANPDYVLAKITVGEEAHGSVTYKLHFIHKKHKNGTAED